MTRTVKLTYQVRNHREQRITITPAWAGKGIAIHKPIVFDENGQPCFNPVNGLWRLSHINTGLSLGSCRGSLDRAKTFARAWDAEFAEITLEKPMAPERIKGWKEIVEEMMSKPRGRDVQP